MSTPIPRIHVAAVAVLAIAAAAHAWPTLWTAVDDAFISARYAEHLVMGHGWTYNTAEPAVEGISNPLWTLWIAVGLALGADVHAWIVGWGLAAYVAALPGAWLLARSLCREPDHGALIAPLALAASPLVAVASTNGLETGAWLASLLWGCWLGLAARTPRAELAAGLGLGLLAAMRPEGVLAGLFITVHRATTGRPWRALALGWAGPVVALVGWRLTAFGAVFPNTLGAKLGAHGWSAIAEKNTRYVLFYGLTWPGVVLALFAAASVRPVRGDRVTLALLGAALAAPALTVEMWMPGGRLLLPLYALAAALVGAASCGRGRLALLPALLVLGPLAYGERVVERDAIHSVLPDNGAARAGRWLREHAPEGATLAIRDAGVLAFWAGPDWAVYETHERALTRRHPGGADLGHGLPSEPMVIALTQNRRNARGIRYPNDRALIRGASARYRFMGRVHQHHHRLYDLLVRDDVRLPPLPEGIVVGTPDPR